MIIVVTWVTLKWALLGLFILSLFAFFCGDQPDCEARFPVANGLRWIVWPLFALLLAAFLIRSLWL